MGDGSRNEGNSNCLAYRYCTCFPQIYIPPSHLQLGLIPLSQCEAIKDIGDCIPMCKRASQLLKISKTAESFKESNNPVDQNGHTKISGKEIDDLLARFESEVLSLVPPYPTRSPKLPATFKRKMKPPINGKAAPAFPGTRPRSEKTGRSRAPECAQGPLLRPRSSGHSPTLDVGDLRVEPKAHDAQHGPVPRSKSTTSVPANLPQSAASSSHLTHVRSPAKKVPTKPKWR